MAKKCLIVTGGRFSPIAPPEPGTFLIACDRGFEYAQRCGLRPDLIVGDLDSCTAPLPEGVPLERHPIRKDDTDTMLALRRALALGFEEVELCCALGNRLDHSLANLQSAAWAARRGVRVRLRDRVLPPCRLTLPRREGWSLSLFALTDTCAGVCIRGVQYPLEDTVLDNCFPLGVSNQWAGPEAELSFSSGLLLVAMCRM